jgi:hypothetical protein
MIISAGGLTPSQKKNTKQKSQNQNKKNKNTYKKKKPKHKKNRHNNNKYKNNNDYKWTNITFIPYKMVAKRFKFKLITSLKSHLLQDNYTQAFIDSLFEKN